MNKHHIISELVREAKLTNHVMIDLIKSGMDHDRDHYIIVRLKHKRNHLINFAKFIKTGQNIFIMTAAHIPTHTYSV